MQTLSVWGVFAHSMHCTCISLYSNTHILRKAWVSPILLLSQSGDTPLHLASYNGHPEVVKYLVDSGASLTLKNKVSCSEVHCLGLVVAYLPIRILYRVMYRMSYVSQMYLLTVYSSRLRSPWGSITSVISLQSRHVICITNVLLTVYSSRLRSPWGSITSLISLQSC